MYTEKDLQPFRTRLQELGQVIATETENEQLHPAMEKLLTRKLEDCGSWTPPSSSWERMKADSVVLERVLNELFRSLSVLSVELVPIHQRLVQIRRQLSSFAALEKPPKAEVKAIVEELRKIDRSGQSSRACPAGALQLILLRSPQQTSGWEVLGSRGLFSAYGSGVSSSCRPACAVAHALSSLADLCSLSILSGLLEECVGPSP